MTVSKLGVVAAVGCALILGCVNTPGTTAGRQPSPPRESAKTGSPRRLRRPPRRRSASDG